MPTDLLQTESLRLSGVFQKYTYHNILEKVDLTLHSSSINILSGSNGAGKTTLLLTLSGIMPTHVGDFFWYGKHSSDNRFLREYSFFKPDKTPIFPDLTLKENLDFFAALHQKKWQNNTIYQLLETLSLSQYLNEPVRIFSFGTKEKIGFLYAQISDRPLKLFDEPFIGIDANSSELIWQLMKTWRAKGDTLFLSTHYLPDRIKQSDNFFVICNKKVLTDHQAKKNY